MGPRLDRIVVLAFVCLFIVCLAIGGVYFTLRSRFRPKLVAMAQKLYRAVFWNGIIRTYLQSFLKNSVTIGLFYFQLQRSKTKPSPSKIGLISLGSSVLFAIIPTIFLAVLLRNRSKLRLKESKERFGSLYLGVKIDQLSTLLQVMEFLAFRFLFVVFTFTMSGVPGILVNVYMLLNNLHIMYLGWVLPFNTQAQNKLELVNSWLLHNVCYCLLLLANLMNSPENEMNVGWAVIALIGLIFLTNFGFIALQTLSQVFRKIYLWKLKREAKKRIAQMIKDASLARPQLVQAVIVNPDSQRPIAEPAVHPVRADRAPISEAYMTT